MYVCMGDFNIDDFHLLQIFQIVISILKLLAIVCSLICVGMQTISIYMVSYAGKAYLQMLVAKDIISDTEFLLNCFQDSFLQIKKLYQN